MYQIDFPKVLAEFGLRPAGDPKPLEGGEDNGNFRVATDRGEVVVREYRVSGIDKVRAELRLVSFLTERGYPTPAPYRTGTGELVVEAERPIAVFPWVPGDVPTQMTEPLSEQVGELLARMHLATADWNDEGLPVIDRLGLLRQGLDSRPELEGVDEWHARMRTFLDASGEDLKRLGTLPSGPLHHDLHRQNLLVANGKITAVLDFDELNRGPLIIDLARVFHYLAVDRDDRRLSRGLAEAVVAGYERTRPLSEAERELLPVAFDLVGLVDAAAFIMWAAPAIGLSHVDECNSWIAYLRNVDALA
ncbi:homoserine kinase [Glycomyces buryatensis]|uniref:Homoserine kinase n=1 Tax=Glycomyces buryatensis TaxID=2570927 RepID=A0A4V4HSH3_9ACTN|nr:homoserine kinase [Glycomyces buryatensis]THV41686.1 homoserine kinase [Glycomyces buryatensis]